MEKLLIDTNIILYVVHGDVSWKQIVRQHSNATGYISVMTFMELVVGARSSEEHTRLREVLDLVHIIPLDTTIANRACTFLENKGRGLRSPHVADAIIAATAAELGIPLLTNNPKDFRRFPGVKVVST
jgi:predicted nucleic acid-binding protein